MTLKRTLTSLGLGLGILCAASSSLAASSTGILTLNTTITSACTIADATINMTAYSSTAGATGTTNTTVNCTLLTPYTVTLGQGSHYLNSSNRMKATVGGTDYFIPYTVTAPVGTLIGTGLAVPTALVGNAASGVNVPAATYTDSVIMTVTF